MPYTCIYYLFSPNLGEIKKYILFIPCRLLGDGICNEKNIPSISSINRIIRDKAILQRRCVEGIPVVDDSDDVSCKSCLSSEHGRVIPFCLNLKLSLFPVRKS